MMMLSGVEIQKMNVLADFLETVPPEDFNLTFWCERNPIAPITFGPITLRQGCGFAGCAMGWAAYSQLFPELKVNSNRDLCYKGATGFRAAAKLFGIKENQAYYFFGDEFYDGHADPAHVAERIRRFIVIVERRMNRRAPSLRLVA